MAVGVAMANAILLVTFAEQRRLELHNARDAAVQGAGALLAVSLISVPVVLATYGFALIASPALLAYAGVVAAGAFVAGGSMPKPIPRS